MPNARLFDGRSAAGRDVAAVVCGRLLEIRLPDGAVLASWPIGRLARVDIDAPGEGATLRLHGGPERLVVSDGALIGRLRTEGAKLGGVRQSWGRGVWIGLAAALLASVALAVVLVDQLPSLATPFVPRQVERAWSAAIEAALAGRDRHCDAPAGQAALALLIGTLSTAAGLAATPSFVVLDNDTVNAFTLPDGRIVIMRGLIARAGDPDAFAGVVAHELGHVLHRDPTREMLRRLELNMLARSLGWGGGVASQVAALSYGRRAEAAADASALETLRRAGLRGDGLGRFFLSLQHESGGNGLPAFLSDHPSMASRADALRIAPVGLPALTAAEWAGVQTICAVSRT